MKHKDEQEEVDQEDQREWWAHVGVCTTYTQKEAGGTDNHTPPPGTAKDRVFTFDCVVNKSSDLKRK